MSSPWGLLPLILVNQAHLVCRQGLNPSKGQLLSISICMGLVFLGYDHIYVLDRKVLGITGKGTIDTQCACAVSVS